MADNSIRRIYRRADFTSLVGNIPLALLRTTLGALVLTVAIADVRFTPAEDGVIVEWFPLPVANDLVIVDAAVAAFVGGVTTSEPFEINSFAATTSNSAVAVDKVDFTTPQLSPGTYQVIWNSSLRMQAIIANTGVRATMRVTRSDGVFVEQTDGWDLTEPHGYNGALTFKILAGQTIRTRLQVVRLGASGVAEISGVRITIDQISSSS
jgi:hypothetical protein